MRTKIIAAFILAGLLTGPAFAAKRAEAAQPQGEVLTKGEAVMLISATDFMKKKIGGLVSWTVGYDLSQITRVKLTPSINYIEATPIKVPPDGRTIVEVRASVNDPNGLANISGVRADLSSLGRLDNAMLVDNGLFGDAKADDGIYTLQTSVSRQAEAGPKEVAIAVANKKGWLAMSKTSLEVRKDPVIIEAKFSPDWTKSDGRSPVTLNVKVENPGRIEDLKSVTVDLRPFGIDELVLLARNGDIFTAQLVVPPGIKEGPYKLRVGAANLAGGYAEKEAELRIVK